MQCPIDLDQVKKPRGGKVSNAEITGIKTSPSLLQVNQETLGSLSIKPNTKNKSEVSYVNHHNIRLW